MTDTLSRRALLAGAAGAAAAGCARPALAAWRGEAGGFDLAPSAASSGARVRVWWYVPRRAWTGSPVLMVMHGQGRDGRDYRDAWRAEADRANAIVVAPELTERVFPGARSYNQGAVLDARGRPNAPERWSFNIVDQAFDAFVDRTGSAQTHFRLYGHSAGAQFVHRYMLFMPAARVERAVAANAGWYTWPDTKQAYPYGLAGAPISEARFRAFLAEPLVLLLGDEDTDRFDDSLSQTPSAERQGPHRLARGRNFFAAGKAAAARLGAPFGWDLQLARGVGHSNEDISGAAAVALAMGEAGWKGG